MNLICPICGSKMVKTEDNSSEYLCPNKDNPFRTMIDSELLQLALQIKGSYDYNFYKNKNYEMYRRLGFTPLELDNNSTMWLCKILTFMKYRYNIVNLKDDNTREYKEVTFDTVNNIAYEFVKLEQYPIVSNNINSSYNIYNIDECVVLLRYIFEKFKFGQLLTEKQNLREVIIDIENPHIKERYGRVTRAFFLDYYFYGHNGCNAMAKLMLNTGEVKYEFLDYIRFTSEKSFTIDGTANLVLSKHTRIYGKKQPCKIHRNCNTKDINGLTKPAYLVELRDGSVLILPITQVQTSIAI